MKHYRIICHSCGQPVETDLNTAVQGFNCPGCSTFLSVLPIKKQSRKQQSRKQIIAAAVVIIGLIILAFALTRESEPPVETRYQYWRRMRESAKVSFAAAVTNSVVGWHRTIEADCMCFDDSPQTWYGSAVVEFQNRVGGIERTNLYFGFGNGAGSIYAHPVPQQKFLEILKR